MSNNIEEDIKELNNLCDIAEVVLPKYSTAKIIYRISEEQRIAIKNILADRERLIKENGKLKIHCKTLIKEKQELTTLAIDTEDKANEYDILVEKIKKKQEKLKQEYNENLDTNSVKAFIIKCQLELIEELLQEDK